MRGPATVFGGLAWLLLLLAASVAPAAARAPTGAGTITLAVSCATNPERTTITNNTGGTLSLTGFQLVSVSNRRPGVPPIRLSGTVALGASREFIYEDDDPNEGARLGTPYGTLTVLCRAGSGILPVDPGATIPTVTPTVTPTSTALVPPLTPPLPGLPNTGMGGASSPRGAIGPALLLAPLAFRCCRGARRRIHD